MSLLWMAFLLKYDQWYIPNLLLTWIAKRGEGEEVACCMMMNDMDEYSFLTLTQTIGN